MERQLQQAAEALALRNAALGQRIKAARDGKRWKQKELAAAMNVEPVTVSRWERGVHTPDLLTLQLLAEKTGRPLVYFTEVLEVGTPPPSESMLMTVLEARISALESTMASLEASIEDVQARLAALQGS